MKALSPTGALRLLRLALSLVGRFLLHCGQVLLNGKGFFPRVWSVLGKLSFRWENHRRRGKDERSCPGSWFARARDPAFPGRYARLGSRSGWRGGFDGALARQERWTMRSSWLVVRWS